MPHEELEIKVRNPTCTDCKLHRHCDFVCEVGWQYGDGYERPIMVVSRMPNSDVYQQNLENELKNAGIDPTTCFFTAALKCRTFDETPGVRDIKECTKYLQAEIDLVKPKWILVLGNEALRATTGHSGIMKYRGRVIERSEYSVFPTVSPSSITRNPGQRPAFVADMNLFATHVFERELKVPPPKMFIVDTKPKLKKLGRWLNLAELLSYDIETTGRYFDKEGAIVSIAGTMVMPSGKVVTWAIPLFHPQSPWRRIWRDVIRWLADYFRPIRKQLAHNGKFDAVWIRENGGYAKVTFDTLLAAHLLDENRQKGLKPQAASRLGVAPWGIDTKDLLTTPIDKVLKYNALDTFYTYHIYLQLREELLEQPRLARIFQKLLMPANEILIDAERRGVWIDQEKLASAKKIAFEMRDEVDAQIMQWVPPEDEWPTDKKGKPRERNFNASIFLRWLLFDHLGLPVIARGKKKDDGSEGDPSVAEAVMMELKGEHPIIERLMERSKWQKYCSAFISAYEELVDENGFIHTTFKLHGTVTGRLSSGKDDEEKITGRKPDRGVNLQQVPRDPFIRGLFGAPPGYAFVEVDFSQVELRVVAFLSRDRTMLRLYQTGQDIHRATAAWVLGIPASKVDKEARKKAKAVNFGFVYGMGAQKFVSTAFEKYELNFTLDEARAIRKQFFTQFSGLPRWHARQRRLVNEHARVVSPLGRVRHLPDIRSEEDAVRGEAERQAINSPVQSFASDMNLLGMIEVDRKAKKKGLDIRVIGTVHDASLFQVKVSDLRKALPLIKRTFENLPLYEKFGVNIDVPIVADIKVGTHWGEARELEEDEVYNWQGDPALEGRAA